MNESPQKNDFELSTYWERLGNKHSLSNRVLLLYLPLVSMNALIVDRYVFGGPISYWAMISLGAHVAFVATIVTFRTLLRSKKWNEPKTKIVLAIFILAQTSRTFTLVALASIQHPTFSDQIINRVLSAYVFMCIVLLPLAIVVNTYQDLKNSASELMAKAGLNRELAEKLREDLIEENSKVADFVELQIEPKVLALSEIIASIDDQSSTRLIAQEFGKYVDEELLPLSRKVEDFEDELDESVSYLKHTNIRPELPKKLNPRNVLKVTFLSASLVLVALAPTRLWLTEMQASRFLVTLIIGYVLSFNLLRKMLPNRAIATKRAVAYVVLPVTALNVALVYVNLKTVNVTQDITGILLLSMMLSFVISILMTCFDLFLISQVEYLQKLSKETEQITTAVRLIKKQNWIVRHFLNNALHGKLQGALYVATLKIAQANQPTKELLLRIKQDIDDALRQLRLTRIGSESFEYRMNQMIQSWRSIIDIRWQANGEAKTVLNSQKFLATCTCEVTQEAITNAVKHGSANRVAVTFSYEAENLIILVESNSKAQNSKNMQLNTGKTQGFGTELYDQLCDSWNLDVDVSSSRFVGELAVVNPVSIRT